MAILVLTACTTSDRFKYDNRDQSFNPEWKFVLDSIASGQEQPAFDDSQWLNVDLPHDWSMMGIGIQAVLDRFPKRVREPLPRVMSLAERAGTGNILPLDKKDQGKTAIICFDGVYMESTVWVNGKKAGNHTYGYTPFWFDITSLLMPAGKENVIAVKVENTGRNSRWYSGSGIYRNVKLTLAEPVHVAVWGAFRLIKNDCRYPGQDYP